jgi:hypothetical protein
MSPDVAPERRSLRAYAVLAAVAVPFGLVFWFLALYPLLPKSLVGWVAATVAGLVVLLWGAVCIGALTWLQRQETHRWFYRSAGVAIAMSLGVGVLCGVIYSRSFIESNFSYFGK